MSCQVANDDVSTRQTSVRAASHTRQTRPRRTVANVAARSQPRSARRHLVVVPRYNRSTYGRRAFSVAGPMIWNSFTDSLRDPSLSINSFRRQLAHNVFV